MAITFDFTPQLMEHIASRAIVSNMTAYLEVFSLLAGKHNVVSWNARPMLDGANLDRPPTELRVDIVLVSRRVRTCLAEISDLGEFSLRFPHDNLPEVRSGKNLNVNLRYVFTGGLINYYDTQVD